MRREPARRGAVLPEMWQAGKFSAEKPGPGRARRLWKSSGDRGPSGAGCFGYCWQSSPASLLWALVSDSPGAQQVQEFVGFEAGSGRPRLRVFRRSAHLPVLQIRVAGRVCECGRRRPIHLGCRQARTRVTVENQTGDKSKAKASDDANTNDNGIQAYVLTEPAFTVWQNGYATSSLYDSGNVAEGSVQADIPAGAGIYYLVFSNKSSPKTPKAVHATVLLRYKSWLPNWVRRMKGRFVDWVGTWLAIRSLDGWSTSLPRYKRTLLRVTCRASSDEFH